MDWHTLWDAIEAEATHRDGCPTRLKGVKTMGVDEHIWRRGSFGQGPGGHCEVDLTPDGDGCPRARLLDVVPGRSGTAYAGWLQQQSTEFIAGSSTLPWTRSVATPTRSVTNSPDAIAIVDASHVVKFGTQVIDGFRRRVQQQTLERCGHKDDPL